MRAQVLTEENGPAGLELRELDDPAPAPGTVVIDVKSCGVCFPDLLISQGKYQLRPPVPFTPGTEVAGVVSAVSDSDTGIAVGDRVLATAMVGGFAEKATAPVQMVLPLPEQLTFDEGAALGINYQTAYFALSMRAQLVPGETVVVLGSAGGIGVASIQVAKALGATVIAAVHRTGAEQMLTDLGADHVVQLDGDWGAKVKELSGGGADVLVDPVGGDVFDEALRQLRGGGRYLVIGFAAGGIPTVKINRVLFRNISIVGAAWGEWISRDPGAIRNIQDGLNKMITAGLRPPVNVRYPLAALPQALTDLGEGKIRGKAVIQIAE